MNMKPCTSVFEESSVKPTGKNYLITRYAMSHRVKRSMHLSRYTQPLKGGSGPTRSMWMWSDLASGVANGVATYRCTLAR